MPFVLRPPGEALQPLKERLARIGRVRRRAIVASGAFRFAAALLFAVVTSCLLDAIFHLPPFARAVLLVGTLAAGGVLFLRGIRGPMRDPTHPLSVALLLEEQYPRFNDSLASAVEFLTTIPEAEDHNTSARFRRIAVLRAQNITDKHDLDRIVPMGRMWGGFWLAVAGVFVTVPLALVGGHRAEIAMLRLADPFGGHRWPTRTTIELREPAHFPTLLAKGDPFLLKFAVHGVIPERAAIQVRFADAAMSEESLLLPIAEASASEVATELRLDAGRVPRDFELRVLANDADTGWLSVGVAPPPTLVPLDGRPSPQVRLTYPAYTDLPAADMPDGTGVVEAVAGTRVRLRAATDRRIVSARIHPQFDILPVQAAVACSGVVGDNALSPIIAQQLAVEAVSDIPVEISGPEGTRLDVEFTPRLRGLYLLKFTDESGLSGTRLLDLRIFPDPVPTVPLARPDPARDPLTLLPTASVPLQSRPDDPTFAVRSIWLEYRVGGAESTWRSLPLADLAEVNRTAPAVLGGILGSLKVKPTSIDVARPVPLAGLVKSDGSAPVDGDTLTIRVAAVDWDDVAWTKGPGRSREVEVRVMGKQSLETMFQKELAGLRPDLLRQREEQRATREAVAEVAKDAAAGKATPEEAGKLAKAEQAQRQLRNQAADPDSSARAKVERLRQALKANELPRSPTTQRVEAVADDLARLTEQNLEAADPAIAAARQEADKATTPGSKPDAKKLADAAKSAVKAQQAAEATLDAVLERLEQWAGAGEVRGEARSIKDQLKKVEDAAAKAADSVPPGKNPGELSPAEKNKLNAPAAKLDELAEQAGKLVGKAARLADEKAKQAEALAAKAADKEQQAAAIAAEAAKQPADAAAAMKAKAEELKAEAAALKRAAEQAKTEADALKRTLNEAGGDQDLRNDLKAAADELRKNEQGHSAEKRQSAGTRLDKLADALSEKPTPSSTGDELQKKRKTAGDDVDKLAEEQDELRKKAKEAAAIPDPGKRAEELKKLAVEQEKLERKAEQLAERLTREKEQQPAEALRRAAEKMEAAKADLERGQPPAEKQDEALDKLDEALKKLDTEQKQEAEQLTREKREELANQLKALRERQAAVVSEAKRIQDTVVKSKAWTRGHQRSYADMEDVEKALAGELRGFTEKQLADLPVFGRMATQAADAMEKAATKVSQLGNDTEMSAPFDAETEVVNDAGVRRPMDTALRRLDQILGSLKDEPKKDTAAKPAGMPPGGIPPEGGGGDGPMSGNGVPPLAQLKALRAIQAEVNDRTTAFAKAHPDPDKFTDDDRDELKELEQTQREIAELFDKLSSVFRPAGESP